MIKKIISWNWLGNFTATMDSYALLKIVNYLFFAFHILLIVFNLFGWAVKKLRRLNLISLSVTAFSWFVIGIFYGFGYCFLTDWHWQVRDKLGYQTDSNSYIHFLITELTNISVSEKWVDIFTAILFFTAFGLSIYTNVRAWKSDHNG